MDPSHHSIHFLMLGILFVCRHFLLQVIDVLLPKIVPEMQDIDFHRRIVTMRTASRKT